MPKEKQPTERPDPLVMKRVAFDANDGGYGAQVVDHFGGKEIIRKSLSKGRYLLGTIMGLNKKKNAQKHAMMLHGRIRN